MGLALREGGRPSAGWAGPAGPEREPRGRAEGCACPYHPATPALATEAAHTRRRWAPHTTLTSTGRRGRGTERRPGRARESPPRR